MLTASSGGRARALTSRFKEWGPHDGMGRARGGDSCSYAIGNYREDVASKKREKNPRHHAGIYLAPGGGESGACSRRRCRCALFGDSGGEPGELGARVAFSAESGGTRDPACLRSAKAALLVSSTRRRRPRGWHLAAREETRRARALGRPGARARSRRPALGSQPVPCAHLRTWRWQDVGEPAGLRAAAFDPATAHRAFARSARVQAAARLPSGS